MILTYITVNNTTTTQKTIVMKNVFLTTAFVLASFSTFATTNNNTNEIVNTVAIDKEYKEISVDQVPQAVKDAVAKDYAGATIAKAYVNTSKEYKLELTAGGESKTVFADATGNWISKKVE